jgi:hypothetical protein
MLDLLFMTFTVYLLNSRDIRDEFVRRGLYFLFIATALRVLVSLVAAFTPPTDYGQMLAVQTIYFEVPYYAFEVVCIAMLASWYQLYRHVHDYIHGIDYHSFDRPKRYSFTYGLYESLLSDSSSDDELIDSLSRKLHY